MIKDTLGAISTAHLVHADCESNKAKSRKCLELAELHSMAVDFAKTGALAEMPRVLKPKEFPDFMERFEKPMYVSKGVLGKLYRALVESTMQLTSNFVSSGNFLSKKHMIINLKLMVLRPFLRLPQLTKKCMRRRYGDMKDQIMISKGSST
ncbi:putative RNA-directed RNA polymerase [Medicago truncatula]|nr:putative RNA-directed RNA polymerase [Medicago truncatula]